MDGRDAQRDESIRAGHDRRRSWPRSSRRSPRTARSPPATPRPSTTARSRVLVGSARAAADLGAPVLGRVVASATVAVEPHRFSVAPVPAIRKVLARAGLAVVGHRRVGDQRGVRRDGALLPARLSRDRPRAGQPARRRDRDRPPARRLGPAGGRRRLPRAAPARAAGTRSRPRASASARVRPWWCTLTDAARIGVTAHRSGWPTTRPSSSRPGAEPAVPRLAATVILMRPAATGLRGLRAASRGHDGVRARHVRLSRRQRRSRPTPTPHRLGRARRRRDWAARMGLPVGTRAGRGLRRRPGALRGGRGPARRRPDRSPQWCGDVSATTGGRPREPTWSPGEHGLHRVVRRGRADAAGGPAGAVGAMAHAGVRAAPLRHLLLPRPDAAPSSTPASRRRGRPHGLAAARPRRCELPMLPPTLHTLRELARYPDIEAVVGAAAAA